VVDYKDLINERWIDKLASEEKIGMPTKGKLTSGAMGLAYGAAGGVVVRFISNWTGSSLVGQIAAAVVGLAVLPEKDGHVLATVIGYGIGTSLNIGNFGSSKSQSTVEIG
jgi:hypothetical protein